MLPLRPFVAMSSCILILLVRIFFRFFGMWCFVCITRFRLRIFHVFLSSPISFDFSSHCIVRLVCNFILVFSSQHINGHFSFLRTFARCRNFHIYPSSLISHPGFVFLFGFLRGTPIISQANFPPAQISSFIFVMQRVRIFVNNFFTFSVCILTLVQSWFLRDGIIVFFSVMVFLYELKIYFSFLC